MARQIGLGRYLLILSCIVGMSRYPSRAIAQESPKLLEYSVDDQQAVEFIPPDPGIATIPITIPHLRRHCHHALDIDDLALQVLIESDPNSAHITHRRPSFTIQLPETLTTTTQVFFSLQDDSRNSLYETVVPVEASINRSQVTLPETVSSLELNHQYYWTFAIPCGKRLRPDSPFVRGCITQTEQGAMFQAEEGDRGGATGSSGVYLVCPDSEL